MPGCFARKRGIGFCRFNAIARRTYRDHCLVCTAEKRDSRFRKPLIVKQQIPEFASMSGLPPQIRAKFEEGNTFSSNKQWHEAVSCYRQVLEATPRHEWALNNLGFCLWQAGEFEEACFRLRQALTVGPNNFMALANLIGVMERLGLNIETVPYRRQLIELRPESSEHTFALANALLTCGRVDEAIYYYR